MRNDLRLILEDAGWYPERRIDIDYMIEEFRREELTIPNLLIESLLKEFWNIQLHFITPDGLYGDVRLNTEVACGVETKALEKCEQMVGNKLVPVASVNEEAGIIFVSYSGKFYLAADQNFWQIGNDFFEALDKIIYQKDVIRIF